MEQRRLQRWQNTLRVTDVVGIYLYIFPSLIQHTTPGMNSMSNVYLSDIKVISMELYLFNKCTILVRIHRDGNMRVSFDSDTISWLYGREWQSLLLALTLTDLAQVAGHLCFWSGRSNIENYMQNKTLKDLCVPRHSGWDKVFSCLWMLVYLTMMPEAKAMVTVIWTARLRTRIVVSQLVSTADYLEWDLPSRFDL